MVDCNCLRDILQTMMRSHKIRLNPTQSQSEFLERCCHANRFAFNWALARWNEIYGQGGKPNIFAIVKEFRSKIDTEFPWIRLGCRDSYASAFPKVKDAFDRFFKKQTGFPKFKSRKSAKMCFTLSNDVFECIGNEVQIPKIGMVNMTEPLRFVGKVMRGTVSKSGGHWWLSVTVEMPDKVVTPDGTHVGIDVGIKTLAATSDGEVLENQKNLKSSLVKLARLNRQLARKKLGSKNFERAKIKLQRLHARIANKRNDHLHKFTSSIASRYQTVSIEDLNVAGMIKNRKLSRAISDTGWAKMFSMLDYKCVRVVRVGRFFPSSKTCNVCKKVNANLSLSDRVWVCDCGNIVDRDLNAALNIDQQGLLIA